MRGRHDGEQSRRALRAGSDWSRLWKVEGKRGAERRWCGIADWSNGEERVARSGVGKRWRAISGGSEGGGRSGWGGKKVRAEWRGGYPRPSQNSIKKHTRNWHGRTPVPRTAPRPSQAPRGRWNGGYSGSSRSNMGLLEHLQESPKNNLPIQGNKDFSKGVFGLWNHFIQNVVVHHESIPQIWWDDLISHISTN
jgi:hypothetical protein